ncbi:type I restriction enzyme HsdR N-terminal domain-containing protein [Chitinophaga lutea]|uniref:Type I restriction enzyme HsdR N-terminal domain-containing protein n=1 Tax=Chitinophaga lutea TaxID=2488634 RepID=A0A3N4PNN5_9BACT|nr:type I restriction enzyme HsdR N-terminal domain-containing protein [Chitinophaga lutea]RPE09776.1 type I restriction enzyme HsdR N-terminal domain-containing protein [Chitinophaga lutea]
MISISFPPPDFRIMTQQGQDMIFDPFRKKYVVLTPEEWVRQNFLNYLVKSRDYPGALMSIEKEMHLGELRKRCDIVVYSREAEPWMIVECKEMGVPLKQPVLEQIVRYHMALPAPWLVITNGVNTWCCRLDGAAGSWVFENDLPDYPPVNTITPR